METERAKSVSTKYAVTQERIDDLVSSKLQGVKFTQKPVYNSRIRSDGKTTYSTAPSGRVSISKVEIGKQSKDSDEYLIDTILHEELEARIALRSNNIKKFDELHTSTEKERHAYIDKVIKRYFRMKGWDYGLV